MSLPEENGVLKPVTVLLLDGGGVRGISSLIILQRLMNAVNSAFAQHLKDTGVNLNNTTLQPNQLFDFVAGTSTGGLIAIMVGKLGMSVDDCIDAYHALSSAVFGKRRVRGLVTGGLWRSRYRGKNLTKNVKRLLEQEHFNDNHHMVVKNGDNDDAIKCAVVCREHETNSKYSDLKAGAVTICSQPCSSDFQDTTVCEAARATSAAFTYFPVARIRERCFSDGGVQYNNPTSAIWDHYFLDNMAKQSRRTRDKASTQTHGPIVDHDSHGLGGFENVTIINIGTGSKLEDTPMRKRAKFAYFIPGTIRMGLFLKETLTKVATESDITAKNFISMASFSPEKIRFHRLSASNGVCWYKLDKYQKLGEISRLTTNWLDREDVQERVQHIAEELASEFWKKNHEILLSQNVR